MRFTIRPVPGFTFLLLLSIDAMAQNLILRPAEIDGLLVNPGMGIETFQRFNGNAINPGNKWSEVGPTGRLAQAVPKPDFPESTIAYCRWYWWQIEPEPGDYRWEILDLAIEQATEQGQKLGIRLMPYDGTDALPEWYRNSGARRANKPSDKDGKIWSPDASDPLYLKHWGGLVKALAERYDGHPGIQFVDISTVGYWGEGWGPYLPEWPVQKALLDLYLDGFKHTRLLTNFDELKALAYGTSHGAGWRADCWGDMKASYWESWGKKWSHMLDIYPQQLVRANAQNAWKHSPVSLESCGTPLDWKEQDYDIDYIFEQALRWHVSSVNIKSTAIPDEWTDEFEAFQKKMGYRLILRSLELPEVVEAGKMFPISMWWLNGGVAPVYYDYELVLQLRSGSAQAYIPTRANVRDWLPGDAVYDDTLYAPVSLRPGTYRVRIALLDPLTNEPAIRLAIEGRQQDGWYDLGEVKVR